MLVEKNLGNKNNDFIKKRYEETSHIMVDTNRAILYNEIYKYEKTWLNLKNIDYEICKHFIF